MAATLDPMWGPFTGGADALQRLTAFVDKACGPGVGVVWAANGMLYPLRAPFRDGDGIGTVAAFNWSAAPPPPPRPPQGFREKFIAFWNRYAEMQYESSRIQAEGNMALARSIGSGIDRMIHSHRDDGAGVVIDVLCVALSLALIPTGLGVLGAVGLVGGAILLGADGYAYAQEMAGDDEGAEQTKKNTEFVRIAATVLTLPDLAFGGFKAVREFREVQELRTLDRATAASAEGLAARTAKASRAERFAQIAEKAHLRAQIRSQQLAAALRLEFAPRGAAAVGISLLIREEMEGDKSLLGQTMQRLQVHVVGVHK